MSRTSRSKQVKLNNWSYKCNANRDFKAAAIKDYGGDMCGYKPLVRHTRAGLLSSWEDVVPSAVHELRH